MSAFVVESGHIRYLIAAALYMRGVGVRDTAFRWFHDGRWHELTDENATEVGQMLWDENITSVAHRYSEDGAHEVYMHRPAMFSLDLGQLFKSIGCYEYQSCEHDGWKASSALAFCDALKDHAGTAAPGYESGVWGAPELPDFNGIRLTSLMR